MIRTSMDILHRIRVAQAEWIADGIAPASLQGMTDARSLLAGAIADRNETMIRIYSETCLLLLEANRRQATEWRRLMLPEADA
jgi:hypothetical protein